MIYDDFKKNLMDKIERQKDEIIIQNSTKSPSPEPLFGIRTDTDVLYERISEKIVMISEWECETLVFDMFSSRGVECNKEFRLPLDTSSIVKFDLVASIRGRDNFIELKAYTKPNVHEIIDRFTAIEKMLEIPGYIVFLLKEGVESQRYVNEVQEQINKAGLINIEVCLFEDFIEDMFGIEEREAFHESMNSFASDMHKAIGYQITEICNSYNLEELKKKLKKDLFTFDYDGLYEKHCKETDIYSVTDYSSYINIRNTYKGEKRYELLLGERDFALSFLTSEWLFQKYTLSEELDNTYVVAGYLKSIEQLLWDVIYLFGQGEKIKGVEIGEHSYDEIKATLGTLEIFIKDHSDIFLENEFVKTYIHDKIDDWRDKYRNNYFHKNSLHDIKKVQSIRDDTIFLYLLILGSLVNDREKIERLRT